MSPQPAVAHKFGFAALSPDIPPLYSGPINEARENCSMYLAPLAGRREKILSNPKASDIGKDDELRQELHTALANSRAALDRAKQQVTRARNDANGALAERVLRPGDNAAAIGQVQAAVRHFVGSTLAIPELAVDSNGRALLAGSPLMKLLGTTLERAPMKEAASVVLGLQRLDALTLTLLGGSPVIEAAVVVLETRAAAEDEEIAAILALRDHGDAAKNINRGDYSSIENAALRSLGLPKEALPKPAPTFFPALKAS